MSLKKFLATVVLGGVLGSSIFAADNPKAGSNLKDEKSIALVGKEAAFQSAMQQLYEELKAEMNKQPAKKQDPVKKPASNPHEPEQMGRVVLGIINHQVKDDENKVAAGVNANVVINNGRLENMVVSGQAGLANVAMSFDARTGRSTTNLSYADKNGSRVDVTLRDCKDPVVSITAPLKFIKGVNFAGKYDSMTGYASARVSANHKRISGNVSYENINDKARTTASISYALPIKHNTSVSLTRVDYDGLYYLSADVLSKIKGVNIGLSARRGIEGKVTAYAVVSGNFRW